MKGIVAVLLVALVAGTGETAFAFPFRGSKTFVKEEGVFTKVDSRSPEEDGTYIRRLEAILTPARLEDTDEKILVATQIAMFVGLSRTLFLFKEPGLADGRQVWSGTDTFNYSDYPECTALIEMRASFPPKRRPDGTLRRRIRANIQFTEIAQCPTGQMYRFDAIMNKARPE